MAYRPTVNIEIKLKCECGNEYTYNPQQPYNYQGINISAHIEGGCETCEGAVWVVECGKCRGEFRP